MTNKVLPEDLNPEITYKGVVRDFQANLNELIKLKEVYVSSGEITEEELDDVMPEIKEDIEYLEHMLSRLKEEKIKDWFVNEMNTKIKENITSEDIEIIAAGLIAQSKLEGIFGGGLKDLLEFISPEGGNSKVLN